ncbi:hypothetical protein ABPG72_007170 [Tetrahymena utriculariae]
MRNYFNNKQNQQSPQQTYYNQNTNTKSAQENVFRNSNQYSNAKQTNQNQQGSYYKQNNSTNEQTNTKCNTQQSAYSSTRKEYQNQDTNFNYGQQFSYSKQTNQNQQECSSQHNYSQGEETTRCKTESSAQMNEKTQKSQKAHKKIYHNYNFKQNEQMHHQKQFVFLSTQYQPQTKIKDWLNLDIPNDLNAYSQNHKSSGPIKQENIQYNYAQGCLFTQFKDQGNQIFKQIISKCEKEKVPINQIKIQLQQAITYYEAAESKSQLQEEYASIHKNIATINFKLLLYQCQPTNQVDLFKRGISSMKQAISFAQKNNKKSNNWYAQLFLLKNQALKEILNTILNQQSDIKIEQSKIISDLKKFAKEINLEIDQDSYLITFKQIFSIQEEFIQDCKQSEDFIQAENLQENLNLDLKQLYVASQKSSNEKVRFFYNQRYLKLNESLLEYQAFKYLQLGNKIYQKEQDNKIINSSQKLIDSQIIWDAVDAYKAAIKLFEGKFLHIEAECYFMLGQIYLEMFGHDCQKSHDYIRNSISLDFNSTKINRKQWYNVAMHTMKILQNKSAEKDSEMFDSWKSKNQSIINQINLYQSKGIVDFAKWITLNYLPSFSKNFKIENIDLSNHKKLLHKVMKLYHADKISGESQHFKFISKEIMIHLTTFYEQVKG